MPTYAIFGASGKVGFSTSSALRKAGVSVRAIIRDKSEAASLTSLGCEVAIANLHDVHSLARAFENADVVQIIIPLTPSAKDPVQDMEDAMERLVSALEISRPTRILLISDFGAHVSNDIGTPTIFHGFEERLGRMNGHKVFLRSAEHMENWARKIPDAIASGTLTTFYDMVDKQFPTISAPDLGAIAAQLLLLPPGGEGTQVVHAEGPRRYSVRDVAEALSEVLSRTIHPESIPRSQWDDVLGKAMSSSLADLFIRTNDALNKGGLIEVEPGSSDIRHGATELKEALRALVER